MQQFREAGFAGSLRAFDRDGELGHFASLVRRRLNDNKPTVNQNRHAKR